MFCLIKKYSEEFKTALVSGKINPDELVTMSSDDRRKYLSQFVGEFNAKNVNTLFESKLLLKNQQKGIINWASKVGGINNVQKQGIIDTISKLDRAINPQGDDKILNDIIEKRLGVYVSESEARTITGLTAKAETLFDSSKESWEQSREYWETRQQLDKFIRDMTPSSIPTTTTGKIGKVTEDVLGVQRSIKTGFDLSAPLRQGRAYLGTKEWNKAFGNMFKYAKSQSALDSLEVDMMSNRYSEYAIKNKHTLGLTLLGEKPTQREEQFVSKLVDKIPGLRGSERAYVGFLNDLRFNRFVNTIDNLSKSGKDITGDDKAMKALADVIATSTGRGNLHGFEQSAKTLATVLFSPRWIASRFEMLTNPLTKTGYARKEAITSLSRLAGTSAALLGAAKMAGADVELDPRSSDFGKAKFGNTRFDLTGGLAPYMTLISRGLTLSSKSSSTGRVYPLNTGKFGSRDYMDVATEFITNKTSPVGSIIRDLMKGESFKGDKVKIEMSPDFVEYLADQLFVPLLTKDAIDAFNDGSGGIIDAAASTGASLFGIGVSTYK